MSVHETVELIETREDLVAFIEQLRLDHEDHPEGWGNSDLASFLDGLAGWTDDMAGYLDEPRHRLRGDPGLAALRDDAARRRGVRVGTRCASSRSRPSPTIPAIAAAIARAIEQLERDEGLTAAAPHERSAWAAEARGELVDDGLA